MCIIRDIVRSLTIAGCGVARALGRAASLDLAGEIFVRASDQTRLTTSFPMLLRAFRAAPRFELNATRPRLRSAISSSAPRPRRRSLTNLPRGPCRALCSAEYINVAINSPRSRFPREIRLFRAPFRSLLFRSVPFPVSLPVVRLPVSRYPGERPGLINRK